MPTPARRFRDLPLFWKFLLPFLALLLFSGASGTFVVVRNLSERAQATLDQELSRRSLDARTALHDKELYLLESVNFASNVRGMSEALEAHDVKAATALLQSVMALKRGLGLLVVTDERGSSVAGFVFPAARTPQRSVRSDWSSDPLFGAAVRSTNGARSSGFVRIDGRTMLAIAGSVCSAASGCRASGVAIAALDMSTLAADALSRSASESSREAPTSGVALFAPDGSLLARAGNGPRHRTIDRAGSDRSETVRDGDAETLYAPFEVEGHPTGSVAVTVSRAFAFATVRGAGIRLALIILGTMVGVVALMALLSRFILVQVRPLVATNRALGAGDLSARVAVKSNDELGELARGVNNMAGQLQASYETLEARVADRTEEVRRLLEQRTEFFTALSHEFRTPLAVIMSEADLLEDPKHRVTIREARAAGSALRMSAEQLLAAINEILELAESDAGGLDIELEEISLSEVVKELRPAIDGLTKGSGLRVSVSVPRGLSPVIADRTRLKEVILNLVDNAVKYTPAGGTVDVSARANNGSIELSIADDGVGIPADVGDRIFEPFFRVTGTKPVRGQASSGLGLALAKRFAEAQGGSIDFASRPEGGTVFHVSLRRAND